MEIYHSDMNQLNLFSGIENKQFPKYHTDNPQIYEAFKRVALQAIDKGYSHWGAKGVFEVIRWQTNVSAKDDIFKVNNSFTAYYARMFANEYPQHKDFFRKRASKFDKSL